MRKLLCDSWTVRPLVTLVAGLMGVTAWAQMPGVSSATPSKERYLLVLRESVAPEGVDVVVRTLQKKYELTVLGPLTEGAVVGLIVESPRSDLAKPLATEPFVASSVMIQRPSAASGSLRTHGIHRSTPGWAMPGLYQVQLAGHFGFDIDMNQRKPAWQDPTWRARDAQRTAGVYAVADALVAEYGGRITNRSPRVDASFGWAMTEEQARRVALDARVASVSESSYSAIDGDEIRPLSGASPRP